MMTTTTTTMTLPVLLTLMMTTMVSGYPGGPPLTACGEMFPTGHHTDAKSIAPPFILTATVQGGASTIAAGDTVNLALTATGDQTYPYFEGMFVQARKADCQSDDPIGTFTIPPGDNFMKLLDCKGHAGSAVSQKQSNHETNKTFTWTVPQEYQGRIYFRATVVKNKTNFWMNVFSGYLTYTNDSSTAPTKYCQVRTSSVSALTASFLTAVLVTFLGIVWNL